MAVPDHVKAFVVPLGQRIVVQVHRYHKENYRDFHVKVFVHVGNHEVWVHDNDKPPPEAWASEVNHTGADKTYLVSSKFEGWPWWAGKWIDSRVRVAPQTPPPNPSKTGLEFAPSRDTQGWLPFTKGAPEVLWKKRTFVIVTIEVPKVVTPEE